MSLTLIRTFYDHVAGGEFASALDMFAEDAEVVFTGPASIPLSGSYCGRGEIERFFGIIGNAFEVEIFQPLEFIDDGTQVAVIGREKSVVRATGKTFDVNWVQVWTVEAGRITRLRDYFDTGTMALAFNY